MICMTTVGKIMDCEKKVSVLSQVLQKYNKLHQKMSDSSEIISVDSDDESNSSSSALPPSNPPKTLVRGTVKPGRKKIEKPSAQTAQKDPLDVFIDLEKEEKENKGKRLSIEKIYQKKSQLEHILLRPDTYIGSVEYTDRAVH
uniref:Uncharacterized protein n=1 Tax=Setaria digitata TaxID=48799 RepID=A0A915Q4D3_9BILA